MTSSVNLDVVFSPGDFVVYPGHGVGKVTSIETMDAVGHEIKLIVINFEQDRMTLRVPLQKVKAVGLRRVLSKRAMHSALSILKQPAGQKRAMWRTRALEYTAKINSGDTVAIAEVVRDLHRPAGEPERSYSERQLYEQALGRLTHEVAAVEQLETLAASVKVEGLLKAA